jgi:hypothetical protein
MTVIPFWRCPGHEVPVLVNQVNQTDHGIRRIFVIMFAQKESTHVELAASFVGKDQGYTAPATCPDDLSSFKPSRSLSLIPGIHQDFGILVECRVGH